MKAIVGVVAIIVALIGYFPYIKDCISGKTKPHVFSWFTWGILSFLTFGIQILNNGGAGSWVNLIMGVICTVILIFGLRNGTKNITTSDIISFILALLAIILWLIVKQPTLSLILVIFIDIMSFLPTMRKAWKLPWSETLFTFEMTSLKSALSIYALSAVSLVTVLYPAYSLVSTLFFCSMLIFRRKLIKQPV